MKVHRLKIKDHPEHIKDRYFERVVIEKLKYEENGDSIFPYNLNVDLDEKKTNLVRDKWHFFMDVVFGEKSELMRDCSPSFLKLIGVFKNCCEKACFFEVNSKEDLLERLMWIDELFKNFNLKKHVERNVEKNQNDNSFKFDYFIEDFKFGAVFHQDIIDIQNDSSICYCAIYDFFANMVIDCEYVYWTCANWSFIDECYKINHSTIEGQCEIFVLLFNYIGSYSFEKMNNYPLELLNECIETCMLPPHCPLRDEIVEMSKRDLVHNDCIGLPFLIEEDKFLNILNIEQWKANKRIEHSHDLKLKTLNPVKISKQKKSKYHEKVKSINLGQLKIY